MSEAASPHTGAAIGAHEAFELLRRSLALANAASGPSGTVLLAVSGGPDSLALLVLAGENRERFAAGGTAFRVATVDHGLRPEAAGEARNVAAVAARFGLPHETLRWTGWTGRGNLPAAARSARYALLEASARRAEARAILVAHHQDDQIETHLMAAARGGGSLAGMRPCRDLAPGLHLLRPFLDLPKARLLASLVARGMGWAEDPANRDGRFRRVQVRQALAAENLDRSDVLGRIARAGAERLRSERALVGAIWPSLGDVEGSCDATGRVLCRHDAFRALPQPVARDFVSRAVTAAGGAAAPPPRDAVSRLESFMRQADSGFAATLNGCQLRIARRVCVFEREYGRSGPETVAADAPTVLFDARFDVSCPPGLLDCPGLRVVPFGRFGRGTNLRRTLPVLVDGEGRALAAHEAVACGLGVSSVGFRTSCRVGWRLLADLRDENGHALGTRVGLEEPLVENGPRRLP